MTKANNKQEFIERWKKWRECFNNKDPNSINTQLSNMLWNYAVWNLINGSRVYLQKNHDGKIMANATLHHSIDVWFFQTQMTTIRRLADECGLHGERGVYSIVSLLKDIIDDSEYLTRENIFELKSLTYDYETIKEARGKWLNENCKNGECVRIPPEFDWDICEELHLLIDILSKTEKNKRSVNDKIEVSLFQQIKNELLNECKRFKNIVDKSIAHAATVESRRTVDFDNIKPTIKDTKHVQEIFCKYANFIQVLLTGKLNKYLPIPQPTLFIDWDKPFFQGRDNNILREIWGNYDKETEKWQINNEELKRMMENVKAGE